MTVSIGGTGYRYDSVAVTAHSSGHLARISDGTPNGPVLKWLDRDSCLQSGPRSEH